MKKLALRAALLVGVGCWSGAGQATTYFGYCWDMESFHYYSTIFTFEGDGSEYDEIVDQWKERLSQSQSMPTYKFNAKCYAATDSATVEQKYLSLMRGWDNNPAIISFSPAKATQSTASQSRNEPGTTDKDAHSAVPKSNAKDRAPAAARAAEDRRKKMQAEHEAVEARNREKQAKYEAELAEQKRQVEEFDRAQQEVARKKEEQRASAARAKAEYDATLALHAEAQRQHDAEMAAYKAEVEAAATKVRTDFEKRHKLGEASTDPDANQCVTTPETQLNASFKGNTAASVMNGCGQPVDVQICLMTDGGWKCGVTYGLASQSRWSFSAFNATGQVFADSRTSGSNKPLASPN